MGVEAGRIRSEKLREDRYRERYLRSLEWKRVEGDGDDNVKHMWELVKRAIVESTRELFCLVRVGGKRPKSVWWNDEVKAAFRRKEVLAASDEEAKERCMEAYREEKRKINRCVYISEQKES